MVIIPLAVALVNGMTIRKGADNMVLLALMTTSERVQVVLRMTDPHRQAVQNRLGRKPRLVSRVVSQSRLAKDRLRRKPRLVKRVGLEKER